MQQPEVNFTATSHCEYEGKNLEIVLKSFKEPFKTTMDGSRSLYTLIEIFDPRDLSKRWGHIYLENPIFDDTQAKILLKSIGENVGNYRDQH